MTDTVVTEAAAQAVAEEVETVRPAVPKRGLGSRAGSAAVTALPPIAVFIALIGLWYALNAWVVRPEFLLPRPDQIIRDGFMDSTVRQQIIDGVIQTTKVVVTGLVIAAALGIGWAVAMSLATWIQRSTYPYAVILQCIPILAIVPLIGVWFGYEFKARVVVCVMIALFPMVSNTLFGLQSVERSQYELFQLQRASRWTVLTKLMFPAALPSIFVGLRTSAGLSVVGAIVGDFFFQRGTPGVGALLQTYARMLEYTSLFAAIFVSALLGVAMFGLFGLLSKLVVGRWYEPVR
ncbi:MAG: NitT/TauT family transport system permease protein [Nocardioidaceae bacterium]|jgi:NitT/TauT family transport system permease protein|nr:NitT/TauT family transport system permease protein [Nocardioidaceae bacterium]